MLQQKTFVPIIFGMAYFMAEACNTVPESTSEEKDSSAIAKKSL